MLAFLPFCGLWVWRQRYRRGLPSLAGVVLSSFVFFLVLSPWLIRNYEVFGRFVFIRDDFGLQFRLGNNKMADGMLIATLQPNLNKLELEKFQRMGEIAYEADCRRLAFDWIREHPQRFAVISMKRFFYFWNGVPRPTRQHSSLGFPQFAFPGIVSAGDLGTRSSAAAKAARSVAFRRTHRDLSHGLLLRVPACPLPPSDRTGVVHPDRVSAF